MVIGIVPYLLEVVVLATDAEALLGVRYTAVLDLGITEDNVLELVHPCVGEHQGRVALDDHRSGWYDRMPLALKEGFI